MRNWHSNIDECGVRADWLERLDQLLPSTDSFEHPIQDLSLIHI